MIQTPRFFRIEEFFPRNVFERFKSTPDRLWSCMDARVLKTCDLLRYRYGPMFCNNWHSGGVLENCGFRPFQLGVGAELSQHKFGRAADLHPANTTAEDIRQDILQHPDLEEFRFIRCLETDVSWLHFDVRNWIGPILMVKP